MSEQDGTVWFVVDHEKDDRIVRGPFEESSTAAAVRRELERTEQYDDANLWIVPEPRS